ncbi:MAG: T9SS type A sorting domain-containing protein [Bacteroidota bacterium]|nr:T9SS type A sorting domain-containing protein [Candidatus Kapabacteria bacterium]MDW8219596.1 T9SS type A sorting domain-containing protein [Bacteroidota bacterium]
MNNCFPFLSRFAILALACLGTALAQPTSLRLLEPAAGSMLRAGTSVDLVWDTTDTFRSRFDFEFATSENGPWTAIVTNRLDSAPPRGRFNGGFRVPSIETRTLFVRMVLKNPDGSQSRVQAVNGPMSIVRPLPTRFDAVLRGIVPRGQTRTLSADSVYALDGYYYVNGVLRIPPGTVILGDTVGQNSAICINRGGQIFAEGTPNRPIVMTSSAPPGQRQAGDWGGLLICGRARTNHPGGVAALEGGIANAALDSAGFFGGNDDNDNSGVVRYVRIEFAGIAAAPNQELNSLTMGGVGRGTTIEYVQCSFGNDDSFEWFGGTVNGRYLIATGALDDDFDGDNGWSGRVQFGLVQRFAQRADVSVSQAFEIDNDASGSFREPLTRPIFSNITAIGPLQDTSWTTGRGANQFNSLFGAAAQIRRNARASIFNSVFLGWPRGIDILSAPGQTAASRDSLQIRNCSFYGIKGVALNRDGTPPAIPAEWLERPEFNNVIDRSSPRNALLGDPFRTETNAFDPRPLPNAPYLANAAFRNTNPAVNIEDPYFERVSYRGAFPASGVARRWDAGWAEYDPQSYEYRAGQTAGRTLVSVREERNVHVGSVGVAPNPATDEVFVRYTLDRPAHVTVRVTDALGALAAPVITNEPQEAGVYEFQITTQNLASGVYFVHVHTAQGIVTQKFSVVR